MTTTVGMQETPCFWQSDCVSGFSTSTLQRSAAAVAARAERIRTCAVTALQHRILDHFANGGTSATWDGKGVMREVLAAVHGAVGHGAN